MQFFTKTQCYDFEIVIFKRVQYNDRNIHLLIVYWAAKLTGNYLESSGENYGTFAIRKTSKYSIKSSEKSADKGKHTGSVCWQL